MKRILGLVLRQTQHILAGSWIVLVVAFALSLGLVSRSQAEIFVTISSAAPQGFASTFIAATTSQFLGNVVANPFASGTYAINLIGQNPNYAPPAPSTASCFALNVDVDTTTLEADLQALVTAGPQIVTDPYVYGFASGMAYAQHQDNILVEQFEVSCSTMISCQAVTSAIDQAIFQESLSTPTVVPGF